MRLPSLFLAALVAVSLLPAEVRAQACPSGTDDGKPCSSEAAADATVAADALAAPAGNATAAITGRVPVRFVADDGDESFDVSTDLGSCRTPCELQLPPGKVRVRFVGPKSFTKKLKIPSSPAVVSIETRSSLRLGLGIAGTVVGGATAFLSIPIMIGSAMGDPDPEADMARVSADKRRGTLLGLGGLVVGATVIATSVLGGIVTNRTGARIEPDQRRADAPRPRLIGLSALPSRRDGVVLGAAFEF